MCLNTITKTYDTYDMNPRFAYKLLYKDNQTPYECFTITEEWKQATQTPLYTAERIAGKESPFGYSITNLSKPRKRYISGFHVFPTREEARKAKRVLGVDAVDYVLRKVEVKGILYEGTDATAYENNYIEANVRTIVAQWIRLIPGRCKGDIMILYDKAGAKYKLTSKQLITLKDAFPFYINFKDAREHLFSTVQLEALGSPSGIYVSVLIDEERYRIGCRNFSRDTFRIIMRAMKTGKVYRRKSK